MAKAAADIVSQYRKIVQDADNGVFAPVYLFMGEEPYYPDLACQAIIDRALDDSERDFNQSIFYGTDSNAHSVASEARSFPMMAERRLVVVKEAQSLDRIDDLLPYCEDPMDSTILVISMHGASLDKRKALYKTILKKGVVLDSPAVKDYNLPAWIQDFYSGKGLKISHEAAQLLGEYTGTDLSKIASETEKMLRNLPEGCNEIKTSDIEQNVGISKQYTAFELAKCLSFKDGARALKIASNIGSSARIYLPLVISGLFTHFYRLLKLESKVASNPGMSQQEKMQLLGIGWNYNALNEYDTAMRNYPLVKAMQVLALLEEFDYKAKGGGGEADNKGLMMELTARILNI